MHYVVAVAATNNDCCSSNSNINLQFSTIVSGCHKCMLLWFLMLVTAWGVNCGSKSKKNYKITNNNEKFENNIKWEKKEENKIVSTHLSRKKCKLFKWLNKKLTRTCWNNEKMQLNERRLKWLTNCIERLTVCLHICVWICGFVAVECLC